MNLNEVLGDIPENLSQYELARYIYIKLGKFFSYDERYYIADTLEEKQEIFDTNIEQIRDDKAVCSQLSNMYAQLLNRFGIKAKVSFKEGRYCGHVVVHFKIDDKLYCADLTHDLLQIKKGFKTKEFMKIPDNSEEQFEEITDEELSAIDSKIGYTYKGMYMDDIIKLLKKDMQSLSNGYSEYGKKLRESLGIDDIDVRKILEYKVEFLKKYFTADGLYCRYRANYFIELLKSSVTLDEINRFSLKTLSCIDEEKRNRMFLYIKDKELQDSIIYTFTDEEYANKVDSEFVCNLIDSGLRPISSDENKKALLLEIAGKQENIVLSELKSTQDLAKEVTTEIFDVALEDETEHFQNLQEQQLDSKAVTR